MCFPGPLVRACRGPRPVCTCSQRSPLQSPVALRACSWDTSAAFWAGASVPQEPAPGPPRGVPFLRSDASASLIPVQSGGSGPMSWGGGRGGSQVGPHTERAQRPFLNSGFPSLSLPPREENGFRAHAVHRDKAFPGPRPRRCRELGTARGRPLAPSCPGGQPHPPGTGEPRPPPLRGCDQGLALLKSTLVTQGF